jgi:hypothetical protein
MHNKPQGCGAPVASAAGPLTTKQKEAGWVSRNGLDDYEKLPAIEPRFLDRPDGILTQSKKRQGTVWRK